MRKLKIALAGNPNVGKSTVFNALTGLRQHTGNWSGKTVDSTSAEAVYDDIQIELTDLPGAYSLTVKENEEEIAASELRSLEHDVLIVVCDATVLERNLILVLQIVELTGNVILCLNMMDEAEKKGIKIDLDKLEGLLSIPVIPCCARKNIGINELIHAAVSASESTKSNPNNSKTDLDITEKYVKQAHDIAIEVITCPKTANMRDRKIDSILTGKYTAVPIMLLLLLIILFITIYAANYPSELLSKLFSFLLSKLKWLLIHIHIPKLITSILCDGILKTLTWIVAVMLPPMAIFFPLFTLLEDVGYLPRIAFNLDRYYRRSGACGKQALTTCMGFGCNAVGVTGCRIIESKRERTIAQLTNSFVPCNGKFPTLISIISMFIVGMGGGIFKYGMSALVLTLFIVIGLCISFLVSAILSRTLLRGDASSFVLELPPYRKPQIGKVIINSLLNRTIFVLGRAVCIAAPAGLIIWLLANININHLSLLTHISSFLDPVGKFMGLDGVILLAFILGFPANEIVIPITIMSYTCSSSIMNINDISALHSLFITNGWTPVTAVCMMLFSMFHWPCSTTCITLYKETKSVKNTVLAFILPTLIGFFLCILVSHIFG